MLLGNAIGARTAFRKKHFHLNCLEKLIEGSNSYCHRRSFSFFQNNGPPSLASYCGAIWVQMSCNSMVIMDIVDYLTPTYGG
jgi:hypothetical protein